MPIQYLWRETCPAGAFCSVFASTDAALVTSAQNTTPRYTYLVDSVDAPRSADADNSAAADALWTLSEKLCVQVLGQDAFKL